MICKADQLTGFYMTQAPTETHFRMDYYTILKNNKYFKKKLDIRNYFLLFREILHSQYKPTWTIIRLPDFNLPFKIFYIFHVP